MTRRFGPILGAGLAAAAVIGGMTGAGAAERRAPGNDNFGNAYTLTGYDAAGNSTLVGATGQPGEPGGHRELNTVWWKWRAPATGQATFDTYGSVLSDAYLCVYTGTSLDSLTSMGCDDDDGIGYDSALRLDVVKDRVYYVQIDGAYDSVGPVVARARYPRCNGIPATIDLAVDGSQPSGADDVIVGTEGNDEIDGLDGNDTICGFGGNDLIGSGPGDDYVVPGPGNDYLNGGVGVDTVSYRDLRSSGARVRFDLAIKMPQNTISSGSDRASQFENLQGGSGNDILSGNTADNLILGGPGNDTLAGAAGNDRLDGGGGTDKCTGGAGTDTWAACETLVGFP